MNERIERSLKKYYSTLNLFEKSFERLTFWVGVNDPEVRPEVHQLLGPEPKIVLGPLNRRIRVRVSDSAAENDPLSESRRHVFRLLDEVRDRDRTVRVIGIRSVIVISGLGFSRGHLETAR